MRKQRVDASAWRWEGGVEGRGRECVGQVDRVRIVGEEGVLSAWCGGSLSYMLWFWYARWTGQRWWEKDK